MPTYPMRPDVADDLYRRFTYHAPRGSQPVRFQMIREMAHRMAQLICTECPDSRERSLALTKLDEAVMHANAAIARNEFSSGAGEASTTPPGEEPQIESNEQGQPQANPNASPQASPQANPQANEANESGGAPSGGGAADATGGQSPVPAEQWTSNTKAGDPAPPPSKL